MKREKIFSEYLLEKYTEWIKSQKQVKSIAEFAAVAGVTPATINKLMAKDSDVIPQLRTVQALSTVCSDIYEFLGISKSQIQLDLVKRSWDKLPEKAREKIAEDIKSYVRQKDIIRDE